jgi:phospholipid/cholesterol/gamma-HCH transport system permease protein
MIGGYLVGVQLIGVDEGAFWSQMQGNIDVCRDILNGVLKSVVFGVAVTFTALFQGYEAQADPGRRVARDHPHRRDRFADGAGMDFLLTALMFS